MIVFHQDCIDKRLVPFYNRLSVYKVCVCKVQYEMFLFIVVAGSSKFPRCHWYILSPVIWKFIFCISNTSAMQFTQYLLLLFWYFMYKFSFFKLGILQIMENIISVWFTLIQFYPVDQNLYNKRDGVHYYLQITVNPKTAVNT